MEALFLNLLNATLNATWLVAVVFLLRACLQKAPKYIRCLLWGIVGLRLLLPFSIESALSLLPSAQPIPDEIIYAQIPSINTGIAPLDSVVNPVIGETLAPQVGESINPVQVLLTIGGYVWLLGLVVMAVYATVSYLLVRRQVREAALLRDNIYLCDHIQTPFILGIFRPRIYLPSAMNEDDRTYVIAHEQAHLARRDHLWKPLGFALLAVYWFNPLLWVAYVFLCRDIELACDEKVLANGDNDKKRYADALVNCSAPRRRLTACPLAFGETGVKGRIKSVLHYKKPAFWVIVVALLACVAVAVCFLTDPKDEWQSQNYGIVGVSSGAVCEDVGFHYREGSINSENPYITVTIKNDSDDTLCFWEYSTLYRNGAPCPEVEARMWEDILHTLLPGGEITKSYAIGAYDLSQNGHYRLETEFYFESAPETRYTAYVNFTIDRIYSFVGWQYAGEGVIYGDAANTAYTDGTVPNVYITDDSVRLQIAENGEWNEIGQLQQDKLDRTMFDYMLTEDWWDAGYSAKLLRQNNKHAVSYVNADADERYCLLEQQNGEIYLAVGTVSNYQWIFRLTPVGKTPLVSQLTTTSTALSTTPTVKPTTTTTVTTTSTVTESTPTFSATVLQVGENAILVEIDSVKEGVLLNGKAWVNTNVQWSHPVPDFQVGMKVDVLYDGMVQETYPLQIPNVYTICDCEYQIHNQTTTTTTTATTRPTLGTQKTRFGGDDFRDDIVLQTEQTVYAINETLYFTLINNADEQISYGARYDLLQQVDGEQWIVYPNTTGTYNAIAYLVKEDSVSKRNAMKLSQYALTVGQSYKVALQVGGEWVVSNEFTVTEPKATTAPTATTATTVPDVLSDEDFRTDVELRLDKPTYGVGENVKVELENKTDGQLSFGNQYVVLKQRDNGEWEELYAKEYHGLWHGLAKGGVHNATVDLSQYDLEEEQSYKLVLFVEGKWVGADFSIIKTDDTTANTTTAAKPAYNPQG